MKQAFLSLLAASLVAGASHAADCPNVKKLNAKNVKATVACLNSAIAELQGQVGTGQGQQTSLQEKINTLQGQVGTGQSQQTSLQTQVGSLQQQVSGLQNDVNNLKGLPPIQPIGSVENNYLRAQAVGLSKFITSDGRAYVTGTFLVQNKTADTLYLAFDAYTFSAVDENGITLNTPPGLTGYVKGIPELSDTVPTHSRSEFSAIPPNGVVSFGITTSWIQPNEAARLGNRFNLTFTLLHYLDGTLDQGPFEAAAIGFASITATSPQ